MRDRTVRIAVIVVDLFAAVSAFAGAIGLVVGFMNIPPSELNGTSFADFTVPALLLGIVVGGSALFAAAIAMLGPRRLTLLEPWKLDALASAAAGCIMVGWITIEVALIGLSSWLQPTYFAVGLLMSGLALLLQRAESRHAEQQIGVRGGHRQHVAA
jgi:hypothetical protein